MKKNFPARGEGGQAQEPPQSGGRQGEGHLPGTLCSWNSSADAGGQRGAQASVRTEITALSFFSESGLKTAEICPAASRPIFGHNLKQPGGCSALSSTRFCHCRAMAHDAAGQARGARPAPPPPNSTAAC